jgi:hypothetical protein
MLNITKERLTEEIKAFKNADFSDCPELNGEQLKQLRPSRFRPQNRQSLQNYMERYSECSSELEGVV